MLDTVRAIETPEGIELSLRVAGPVPRALAWSLDTILRAAGYLVLSLVLMPLGRFGLGALLIAVFLLEWFYPVFCEVFFHGVTPGKKALGLRVLHDDGTPVGWSASLIRNLLRFVDFLPLLYGFGLVSILWRADFKRLGDIAAGTQVVYQEEGETSMQRPSAAPRPPAFALTTAEQQAVVSFAERRSQLTEERAEELAMTAAPLVAGARDPADRLLSVANWVAGEH